jgi:hypothetical protein
MQRIFKILTNIGLGAFLIWTGLLVLLYLALLWDKIVRPQYKNMNTEQAIYFGLLALVLVVLDIFIVRRFVSQLRRNKELQTNLYEINRLSYFTTTWAL